MQISPKKHYLTILWTKNKEINGDYRCVIIICDSNSVYFSDRITQILKLTTFLLYQCNSILLNKTPSSITITLKFTQELTRMKILYQQTMLRELRKSLKEGIDFIFIIEYGYITDTSIDDQFKNILQSEFKFFVGTSTIFFYLQLYPKINGHLKFLTSTVSF